MYFQAIKKIPFFLLLAVCSNQLLLEGKRNNFKNSLSCSRTKDNILYTISTVTKEDFKKSFGCNLKSKYVALCIELDNQSMNHYFLMPESLSFPLMPVEKAISSSTKLTGITIGELLGTVAAIVFFPVAFITAWWLAEGTNLAFLAVVPIATIGAFPVGGAVFGFHSSNQDLQKIDYCINNSLCAQKGAVEIAPYTKMKRYIFVQKNKFDPNFTIQLFDDKHSAVCTAQVEMKEMK